MRTLVLVSILLICSRLPLSAQPYQDTLRALVVFVKMQDDRSTGDPQVSYRDWPLFDNPAELPAFAKQLLHTSPYPPYPDSSLTAYFHQQSMGQYVLFGEVYDSVLVTAQRERNYHRPEGGYGALTEEILDKLDRYGVNFNDYDYNADGLLDHLFIVVRSDTRRDNKTFVWTGASCLDGRCAGGVVASKYKPNPVYDGVEIDWNKSGSYIMHRTPGNILPLVYHVRLMAHEIGHDIWADHFVHIRPFLQNDVPAKSNRGRTCIGYVLMAGAGGGYDCGGHQIISAFERDLLGWISCHSPTEDEELILGDLYTTGDCVQIPLSQTHTHRRLYLTNHQDLGYFDQERAGGINNQFDMGLLRAKGLLIHLADKSRLDVIPADNSLDLSTSSDTYIGDLYDGEQVEQITPWTRPNINGFNVYPEGFDPSWFALDEIKTLASDPSKKVSMQYIQDFRRNPIIREDSWIGPESEGTHFQALLYVKKGTTLQVNTSITLEKGMVVETGARVHIERNGRIEVPALATITLQDNSELHVKGVLHIEGQLRNQVNAVVNESAGGKIMYRNE